ncbi:MULTISPECIES: type IX secretion system protein PorG [Flammeovirga]|uniref:DUF6089 domain-containing protein n=1 Tax=Flammeovirga agarivorans TaxID=2726742 RepID=A0A7X8SJ45_9BACT|nr:MULTISPECIES: DUF6089 family protein [Flammeovirga]NLR91072.1 hypothetical protein [Flammeovirga agarivorans]
MKRSFFKLLLSTFLLLLGFNNVSNAQYWVVGGAVGATGYSGDVSPVPHPADYRVGVKAFGKYNMNNFLQWRTDLNVSWNAGSDIHFDKPIHQGRQASFQNVMINVATGFEYNFLDFRQDKRKKDNFTPYFFMELGGGVFPVIETTYSGAELPWAITLPLGIGFKKRISTYWDFGMEFSITKPLWTDNTDTIYRGGPDAPVGEQTVYPSWRDNYYFLGFTLSYNILNVNCPDTPR